MICFAWDGFPQYAARCVGAFVRSTSEKVVVVATRPVVPIRGMEEVCGCPVVWIGCDETRSLGELLDGSRPRVLLVSGWGIAAFNRFRDEMRAQGIPVFASCDNNWIFPTCRSYLSVRFLKECLKALRFRVLLRDRYDGFCVPGKSGRRLLAFYGVPQARVFEGMYAADDTLFHDGRPLAERPRKIIYVGQFIERKNVRRLVQAFQKANQPGWTLEMYGSGPLKEELLERASRPIPASSPASRDLKSSPPILIHDFLQPEQLAEKYREARIFILPSVWEHWGLVVHEAALSGCALLLGNRTGAADDMLGSANGRTFDPCSVDDIARCLVWAMNLSEAALDAARKESLSMSANASLSRFVSMVRSFSCKDGMDP